MRRILIVGSGGLAREFSSYFSESCNLASVVGFSSFNVEDHKHFKLPGHFFEAGVTPASAGTDQVVIAIGSPSVKRRIVEELRSKGFQFPSFIHPKSVVSNRARVGEGVVISPNCTVSPDVQLGDFSYLNFGVGVGHDAFVGSFVQINPGVQLGGATQIGNDSLIGSGSTVLQGVRVGCKVTIASGSVVFSRVADGATMLGNPAKRMRSFEEG